MIQTSDDRFSFLANKVAGSGFVLHAYAEIGKMSTREIALMVLASTVT